MHAQRYEKIEDCKEDGCRIPNVRSKIDPSITDKMHNTHPI